MTLRDAAALLRLQREIDREGARQASGTIAQWEATMREVLWAARRHLGEHWEPFVADIRANEPPARALLDRSAHAELLVLGTTRPRPQPGQPPQAMGPVARPCLRLAHCPVVVVSPEDRPAGERDGRAREQEAASRPAARTSSAAA